MSSKLFRTSTLFSGFIFVFLFVLGTSISYADRQTPSVCEGQTGSGFGLCRAAVASGCDDSNSGTRYCDRIANNFTKQTGQDPVWLSTEDNEEEIPTETIQIDLGSFAF
jgi:hypothetical protein